MVPDDFDPAFQYRGAEEAPQRGKPGEPEGQGKAGRVAGTRVGRSRSGRSGSRVGGDRSLNVPAGSQITRN